MNTASVSIVTYNAQAATSRDRLTHIVKEFSGVDIILLQGTKQKELALNATTMKIGQYSFIRWPAGRGQHTNTSTGVAIGFKDSTFPAKYRRQVWHPAADLQGRGGAVRCTKRNSFDWCFISVYLPVNGQDPKGADSVLAWVDSVLSELPVNCIPIVGMDANGKVGMVRSGGYLLASDDADGVGPHGAEVENDNGKRLRSLISKHYLRAVNTFHEAASGATFWSHEDRGSRIDYICAPAGLVPNSCALWRRSAHKLQLCNHAKLRDHTPLFTSFSTRHVVSHPSARVSSTTKWNRDALMSAWVTGVGEVPFVEEIERWASQLDTQTAVTSLAQRGEVDDVWHIINSNVNQIAQRHFCSATRAGKYQSSPEATALWRTKQQLRAELRATEVAGLPAPRTLMTLFSQWRLTVRLQKCDKQLAKLRRQDKRRCIQAWCEELEQCTCQHDWASVWKLSRKIGRDQHWAQNATL